MRLQPRRPNFYDDGHGRSHIHSGACPHKDARAQALYRILQSLSTALELAERAHDIIFG